MAGHVPPSFEGHFIQARGTVRHGTFPGHRHLEPHHPTELLENKMAVQEAEIERFTRENQRLAATHVSLRHDLVATQQEMQRLQAHIGSIQTESDIQIRILLDKMAKMEADIRIGESIRKDLIQAHKDAKSLIMMRQELTTQLKQATQELQKAHSEVKKIPELHAELNSLVQEHQRLRVTFEYEKGMNIEQVQQMYAMESNLVAMAREVEKLRAEVANAESRAYAPYAYGGGYGNPNPYAVPPPPPPLPPPPPPPPPPAQGVAAVYVDGYPGHQMGGVTADNAQNLYTIASSATTAGAANGSSGGTSLGGGGGGVTAAAVGGAVVSSGASGGWEGSHDAVSAPPPPLAHK
ncbi:hypothetical protein BVC80_1735g15 [Macleaya cordata]|uniref:Protein FLX-like 4 n=1 Tax=Macleaya cordata TaxID=56857 RepID=A0A200Q8Y9_MACCD|nr:hypothetical protein BVC80_1735g15 [Macleaya cordata]